MFLEVELLRHVAVLVGNLNSDGLVSSRHIVTRLLEDLLKEKASKDHGYFLGVTRLKSIGKGVTERGTKFVSFPVAFSCRTFLPLQGEVLQGVVSYTLSRGVFLRCGPAKYAFLSVLKMPNYNYISGKTPFFINNQLAKIEEGVVVRFKVLAVKFRETRECLTETREFLTETETREFLMLASLDGDCLGPVASPDKDDQFD